jgi:hypothetical protein
MSGKTAMTTTGGDLAMVGSSQVHVRPVHKMTKNPVRYLEAVMGYAQNNLKCTHDHFSGTR